MSTYLENKLYTLIATLLLFGSIWMFADGATGRWSWLLIFAFSLGYAHYFVGAVFQWKSIMRRGARKEQWHFWAWIGLSILATFVSWVFALNVWLFVATTIFFVVHGALNEMTFIERYAKEQRWRVATGWSMLFLGLLVLLISLPHVTVQITPTYSGEIVFLDATTNAGVALFEELFFSTEVLTWVLIGIAGLGVLVMLDVARRMRSGWPLLVVPPLMGLVAYQVQVGYFVFAVVLFLILAYHFLSWFFVFFEQFRKTNHSLFQEYVWWHVVCLLPLVLIVGWLQFASNPQLGQLFTIVFNMNFYLGVTFAHLATSLVNERWYKQLFHL